MKNKIAVTTTSFGKYDSMPFLLLKNSCFDVVINTLGRKLKKQEILQICNGCIGIIAGTEEYDAEVLSKMRGLKVISRCGTGLENIDINIAKKMGIKIFNTPDAPVLAVAELTVGLMLALIRKTFVMDRQLRCGVWEKHTGNLLYAKKVGIIGFGKIGKRVAQILKAFDAQIAYTDHLATEDVPGVKRLPLKDLLGWADILSVHASGKERILGRDKFRYMKKGAWLLNLSRGEALDETALYESLEDGHLSGAALDVFEKEPYVGPLKELDTVILTPHVGSYAKEARIGMEKQSVDNLLRGLEV